MVIKVTDRNDVEKVLGKLGIKLRDGIQDWRDVEDVIDDVGKRWKSFTEVEKTAIATAMGGKVIDATTYREVRMSAG